MFSFGDFLIIWVAVVFVAVTFAFRAHMRKSERRIGESSESTAPERSSVGGMRWTRTRGFGQGAATKPLVRLSVFGWGVRWSPSAWLLQPFAPVIEIRFDAIECARAATLPHVA